MEEEMGDGGPLEVVSTVFDTAQEGHATHTHTQRLKGLRHTHVVNAAFSSNRFTSITKTVVGKHTHTQRELTTEYKEGYTSTKHRHRETAERISEFI